jgi:hypothetical protein
MVIKIVHHIVYLNSQYFWSMFGGFQGASLHIFYQIHLSAFYILNIILNDIGFLRIYEIYLKNLKKYIFKV